MPGISKRYFHTSHQNKLDRIVTYRERTLQGLYCAFQTNASEENGTEECTAPASPPFSHASQANVPEAEIAEKDAVEAEAAEKDVSGEVEATGTNEAPQVVVLPEVIHSKKLEAFPGIWDRYFQFQTFHQRKPDGFIRYRENSLETIYWQYHRRYGREIDSNLINEEGEDLVIGDKYGTGEIDVYWIN